MWTISETCLVTIVFYYNNFLFGTLGCECKKFLLMKFGIMYYTLSGGK